MATTVTEPTLGISEVDTQDVDESKVVQLFGADIAQDLAGQGWTYRHDWGNKHGSWRLNLNSQNIHGNTRVFCSVGEGLPGGPPAGKFLGDAKYTLMNVAPAEGHVGIWVQIDWGSDIRLYVDYLIINP
jgi:hypothetical protein